MRPVERRIDLRAVEPACVALDTTVGASGGSIGQTGRYVQYRLQLSTSDDRQTPVVRDVTLNGVNQ